MEICLAIGARLRANVQRPRHRYAALGFISGSDINAEDIDPDRSASNAMNRSFNFLSDILFGIFFYPIAIFLSFFTVFLIFQICQQTSRCSLVFSSIGAASLSVIPRPIHFTVFMQRERERGRLKILFRKAEDDALRRPNNPSPKRLQIPWILKSTSRGIATPR